MDEITRIKEAVKTLERQFADFEKYVEELEKRIEELEKAEALEKK